MSISSDINFWNKNAPSYAKSSISDEAGYQHTLDRTAGALKPTDNVLELGCGTGTTALRLAPGVQSYLGTDFSPEMIKIATNKLAAPDAPSSLSFRTATVEVLMGEPARFTAILGFNYLHMVHDIPHTLRGVHSLLEEGGLFITKTACLKDMNVLFRVALPVVQFVGKAPYVAIFPEGELTEMICAAGFEILDTEKHASKGSDARPYIIARKK